MTSIVSMALGKTEIPHSPKPMHTTANFLLPTGGVSIYIAVYTVMVTIYRKPISVTNVFL